VMLYIRKQGGTQFDYLTITMENVYVSSHRVNLGFDLEEDPHGASFDIEAGTAASALDAFITWEYGSMSYGKLTFQYNQQQKDGSAGPSTIKFFDFTLNQGG